MTAKQFRKETIAGNYYPAIATALDYIGRAPRVENICVIRIEHARHAGKKSRPIECVSGLLEVDHVGPFESDNTLTLDEFQLRRHAGYPPTEPPERLGECASAQVARSTRLGRPREQDDPATDSTRANRAAEMEHGLSQAMAGVAFELHELPPALDCVERQGEG